MKYSVCMSTVNHIINDDLITFNGHPFSLASCFSLMDEIFSLHEHRHLITFNGHRILLVFLVNL
jgi:hypothetical protein